MLLCSVREWKEEVALVLGVCGGVLILSPEWDDVAAGDAGGVWVNNLLDESGLCWWLVRERLRRGVSGGSLCFDAGTVTRRVTRIASTLLKG